MKTGAVVGYFGRIVYALCLIAVGAVLAINGARLIYLGGSFYYLPIGLATVLAGAAAILGKWRAAAGVYFARLQFGTQVEARKIVLTR